MDERELGTVTAEWPLRVRPLCDVGEHRKRSRRFFFLFLTPSPTSPYESSVSTCHAAAIEHLSACPPPVRGKNPNRNLCLPHDRRAAFAFSKMLFQLDANRSLKLAVDIIRDLVNGVGAVQLGFLSRKKRSSFVRNFNRARSNRDFTAGTEMPIACAVSSVESSSISRNTNTVRKSGSS